jgi:hypothetical protein
MNTSLLIARRNTRECILNGTDARSKTCLIMTMLGFVFLVLALQLSASAQTSDLQLLNKKSSELGELLKNAKDTEDDAMVLKGIEGFVVAVISMGSETVISNDELRTKIELTLRRNKIKVGEKIGRKLLTAVVEVFKGESTTSYSINLSIPGTAYYPQKDGFVKINADIWKTGRTNRCGNHLLKSAINDSLVELTESLCNQYLKHNQDILSEGKPAQKK